MIKTSEEPPAPENQPLSVDVEKAQEAADDLPEVLSPRDIVSLKFSPVVLDVAFNWLHIYMILRINLFLIK